MNINKQLFTTFKKQNIFQNYSINKKIIGKGRYGVIYEGRLRVGGPKRAIKRLPLNTIRQTSLLMNQVKILAQMDHPNIIKAYEIYQYQNSIYIISDLCQGGELYQKLDQLGPMNQQTARDIFVSMVEAVSYLHAHKIAHRDLKPQNFLFVKKGSFSIKLIDLGLAIKWNVDLNKQLKRRYDRNIVGTSYYLSPQVAARDYDERCDIWSLGVILYIMLSNNPPFDGKTDKQIIQNVSKMKYDLQIQQFKNVSKQAKHLISRILVAAKDRINLKQIFQHPWIKSGEKPLQVRISIRKIFTFSRFTEIKKLMAVYVASQLPTIKSQTFGKIFRSLDINHDGYISFEEFKKQMNRQSIWFSESDCEWLFKKIDVDGNGKLSYFQFIACSLQEDQIFVDANLMGLFRLIDKDGSGQVDKKELLTFFKAFDSSSQRYIQKFINSMDTNKSGTISFQQFKDAITQ